MKALGKTDKIQTFYFEAVKYNKHSTIYKCKSSTENTFLTPEVKIEAFQGFSKAFNLPFYFRIKDQSSWARSRQITGLFKTTTKDVYYGDFITSQGKTLLIFKLKNSNEELVVYKYPDGYYPSKDKIDFVVKLV